LKRVLLIILLFITSVFANSFDTSRLREFSLRFGGEHENIVGDFTFAGASVLCVKNSEGECDWNYDGYLYNADTKFVRDDSSIALNSAKATLNLPPEVEGKDIKWAGLYWQGHIEGSDPSEYEEKIAGFNEVVFETPDGVKHTISVSPSDNNAANYYTFVSNDYDSNNGYRFFYQCFADVTDLVKNSYSASQKTFIVGNIKTTEGEDSFYHDPLADGALIKYGHWGGWSLIVVYERNSVDQAYKNISIFDGFQVLIPMPNDPVKSIEIPVSGFLTPLSGSVDSRLLYFAMGGEKKISRDSMEIYKQHAEEYEKVSNAVNAQNNVLNGSISFMGNYIDPSKQYMPGLDLDLFDSSPWMENDQNMTKLKLSAVFEDSNGDQTFTGVIAFSTKIHSPLIDNFLKTSDKGSDTVLNAGDEIEYRLDFNNSGSEIASDITIYDDFTEDNLSAFIEDDKDSILKSIRLSADNDPEHFYCYEGASAEGCDYAFDDEQSCDVDLDENGSVKGVHCTFSSLDVGHRRVMKFKVKIKEDFISFSDHRVVNQAHSRYKNARTGEWVDAMGKSNVYVAGMIRRAVIDDGELDVIDASLATYEKYKGLHTKIAKERYGFKVVSLDPSFRMRPFQNDRDVILLFRIIDLDDPSYSYLLKDTSFRVKRACMRKGMNYADFFDAVMPSRAIKRAKIRAKYINFLKQYARNRHMCLLRNQNRGNIADMPECVEDTVMYKEAFGEDAYNRCILNNGSPCKMGNEGKGAAPYDHEEGCYECTADALGSYIDSSDDFAIRPFAYRFDIPSKAIAADDFSLKVKALDKDLNVLNNYNESINNSYKITYKDDKSSCFTGILDLTNANFSNGLLNKTTRYSEIGKLDLNISEIAGSEFALTDSDDTPLSDRLIPSASASMEFIPKDFYVTWTLENANTLKNYTYYSNDLLNMGAKLKAFIKARNKSGNIVRNYSNGCYAKDCNLTITMSADGSDTSTFKLKWMDFYNPSHRNDNALNFTLPLSSGNFVVDIASSGFLNGESNQTVLVNFDRSVDKALEPMKVKFSKVKANDADIWGESLHDEYLYYYYARMECLDQPNIVGATLNDAPIYYEVYCKNCDKSVFTLANGSLSRSGDLFWYQNNFHSSFDGKVDSYSSEHGTSVSDVQLRSFDLTAPTLPHSDTIHFTPSSWLVYDSADPSATDITFNVTFLNADTKWAGEGKLGHVVDQNISIRKNRKISW